MAKPNEGIAQTAHACRVQFATDPQMVDELPKGSLELLQKAEKKRLDPSDRKTHAAKHLENIKLLRDGTTTYWGRFIARKLAAKDKGTKAATRKTIPNTANKPAKKKPVRKTKPNTAKKAATSKKAAKKKATKKTAAKKKATKKTTAKKKATKKKATKKTAAKKKAAKKRPAKKKSSR
jgi:hypothetical protein